MAKKDLTAILFSIFIFIIVAGNIALVAISWAKSDEHKNTTTLEINNTFPISVVLETKCDVVPGTSNYKFYKRIIVPKSGKYELVVPSSLRKCEIWTISYKLVGSYK